MQYLLLIYEAESVGEAMSDQEKAEMFQGYMAFTEHIRESGEWLGGEALTPVHTATSVRVREGRTRLTDGPFAETREQLGGYYLVECKDLDRANELAAMIPTAKTGTIEVRPIMKWE